MSTLRLEIADGKTTFLPGDPLSGMAMWQLDKPAKLIEIRLFWYTTGKGTQDVDVVATVPIESPPQSHASQFNLTLPNGPYSFSGQLTSLVWALELVVTPSKETERVELTLSPSGGEIVLNS